MNNLEQIVCQYYKDKNGNPMSYHIRRRHQISPKNYQIQLDGIPDDYRGIEVIEPSELYRVHNADEITEDSYWVRDDGNVFFHKSRACQEVMLDYYSIGLPVVGAGRIYTLLDEEGNVIETLEDILKKGQTVIEALKTMNDVIVVINELKTSIYEGTKVINTLDITIDEGYKLLAKLNAVEYIQRPEFNKVTEEINDKIDNYKQNTYEKIKEVEDNVNTNLKEFKKETNRGITDFKNKINKVLDAQKFVVVYLNEYSEIAKQGTLDEDWSLAFNHVFENVVKESVATIKWNGRLKIKSTINLPKHINLEGIGLPWSGLVPTSDFEGEYVITDLNEHTHNSIKKLYFDFAYNKNIKGIKVLNPYDYNEYKMLVADGIGDCFLQIGGDIISQSSRIEDCVAYRENMGDGAIVELRNCQEFYLSNNKFLYKTQGQHECVWCDGVTNTTFIHNSFAFTNETALKLLAYNYPKRLNGNLVLGNLFEGIGQGGCINLIGSGNSDLEGSYNTIRDNSYFSSTAIITLGNISNTYICDPVQIKQIGGDRRTYFFNKYNITSSQVNGNIEEYCDGSYKHSKSWFCIDEVEKGGGSYLYMYDKSGNRKEITIENNKFVIK